MNVLFCSKHGRVLDALLHHCIFTLFMIGYEDVKPWNLLWMGDIELLLADCAFLYPYLSLLLLLLAPALGR